MEPQNKNNSVDNESTLSKFTKQKFGIKLFSEVSEDDIKPDVDNKPSGKGSFNRSGNTKFNLDCYGIDIAPIDI